MASLCRRADDLTAYAWVFRYPGGAGAPTEEDAQLAIGLAREVYEAVLDRIPPEAHP